MVPKSLRVALAAAGVVALAVLPGASGAGGDVPDPLLDFAGLCGPVGSGQPATLRAFVLARVETAPFQPVPAKPEMGETPVLYRDLGTLSFATGTSSRKAQAWFDQGVRLAYGFNHAEAQRAFREAQKADPQCALCYWGEALVLGPNINAPMAPEANAPALAALAKARELAGRATARDRALIEALAKRYADDPKADRAALDRAYADAMRTVAKRFVADDNVQVLYAEALMDTQPWDYWEAGGTKPKGSGAEIVATLERVLERNPDHPGAIHFYIHAVEASTKPERALRYASRLGKLVPGAGHLVHMPAHIYYRVGMYRESLEANRRAIAVDERYFQTSPSDPMYRAAYYPHNIHFVMVSAQIGGDGATAIDAAAKLDKAVPDEVVKQFAILEPVKAAPYTTHAQFSDPGTILALPAPANGLVLVRAMYHYARAIAFAASRDLGGARAEIDALAALERDADFKPFAEWNVPAREIVQTAALVAAARLADASGDLDAAARSYEDAIFIEDSLSYMEPAYWYYPIRQSLAAVKLRQGQLDEAEKLFRDSLGRVRNNGWALAGLAETYRRKGDRDGERAARRAFDRAWFGPPAGPAIERL